MYMHALLNWYIHISGVGQANGKSEADLLDGLLNGYNAMVRPVKDLRNTLNVTAQLRLVSIDELVSL